MGKQKMTTFLTMNRMAMAGFTPNNRTRSAIRPLVFVLPKFKNNNALCCKEDWCMKILSEDIKEIKSDLAKLKTKNEKQKFLEKSITLKDNPSDAKTPGYILNVYVDNMELRVCQTQFISLMELTDERFNEVIANMTRKSS